MSRFEARFNTINPGIVQSVGTTATKVFNLSNRRVFRIRNTHATQTLAVGWDDTVDPSDASTFMELLEHDDVLEVLGYTGEVWVEANGASTTFNCFEGTHAEITNT